MLVQVNAHEFWFINANDDGGQSTVLFVTQITERLTELIEGLTGKLKNRKINRSTNRNTKEPKD